MFARTDLAEVIGERTMRVTNLKKIEREVAAYLLEQNEVASLDSLMRDVLKYRAEHGIIEATAVSAFPLSGEARSEILATLKAEYPSAKQYRLNEKIDSEIISGVRLEMVNEELDLSVRARLNILKRLTTAREK